MILLKKSFSSLPATLSLLAALAAVSCTKVREVGNEPSPAGTVQFAASLSGYAAGDNDLTKTTATSCREFTGGPMKLYLHSISSDRPSETVAFSSLKKEETDTKGAVTTSVYSTMAVSGYMWTGAWDGSVASNYCYKKTMNWAGGQWVYDGRLVWPGADMKLRFYSVSPASVPDLTWSGESATGAPTVTYTSPTTIASQVDFLDAVTPDIAGDGAAVSSTVTFTFNHALTAVRFNAAAGFGAAVTVKSITLSGVYGTGTHVIGSTGTSAWTGHGGVSAYVLNPGVALTAGGASKPLSSGGDELLLIPQTCPSGALATVVLTWEGDDYTLECNLAGEVWEAGKEVVYTVSLSESDWVNTFLSLDGAVASLADNTSSQTVGTVYSYRQHASGIKTAIPWTVTYSTDGGETWSAERPSWLSASTMAGAGGWSGEPFTVTATSRTECLTPAPATFGATQGNPSNYIDLSKVHPLTRASMPRETANCYIVNAPGYYKIPLFYGNAIVNGSANAAAYPLQSGNANYGYFYNAYGEEIGRSGGSGNIASDLTAGGHTLNTSGGRLVWCTGNENLVVVDSDLENGGDGVYYLKFRVPEGSIQEGNAVVGVLKDGSTDEFVWSWHVWIVSNEMNLMTETYTNAESTNIDMLNWALGATQVPFMGKPARSCLLRINNGMRSETVTLTQPLVLGAAQNPVSTYYQWGRPNALPPTTVTSATTDIYYGSTDWSWTQTAVSNMAENISKPYNAYWNNSFFGGGNQTNLWDADMNVVDSDQPVNKTVYDPCPAGFSVPRYNFATYFSTTNKVGSFDKGWWFKKTPSDPTGSFWAASGGRFSGAGVGSDGNNGYYWSATMSSSSYGRNFYFYSSGISPVISSRCCFGLSVRPAVCSVP